MATDRLIMAHEDKRVTARGLSVVNGLAQAWHEKGDVLIYTVDWSDWLGSETIATNAFTQDGGATLSGASNTTTEASVLIALSSGGSAEVTNKITTSGGQTRSLRFRVNARCATGGDEYACG